MYLGVDAGNSKTVALLCRPDGTVVGTGSTGCGDIYGVADVDSAVRAVLDCVRQSLDSAGLAAADVHGAAFRLAGVDWPEDGEFWQRTLGKALPAIGRVSVLNDGFAPIRCAELSGVAVAVTVGTGSAIAGRGPQGTQWSLSWWGQDRLGAAGIGHLALAATFRQELGLGGPTSLGPALLRLYGETNMADLLHSFTRRHGGRPWQDKGRAAPAVLAAADEGDPVATAILNDQAVLVADYARVTAERAGFDARRDAVPVVLAGPVLTTLRATFRSAVIAQISRTMPVARTELTAFPPAVGAALDALAEAGVPLDSRTRDTMIGSLPNPASLSTETSQG
jgi:N-acetylglucosamine kinase-like BadF-type ATPase